MRDFRFLHLSVCAALCLSSCAYADKELAQVQLPSNAAPPVADSGTTQITSAQSFGVDERPLVTIHSESADVDYERPLHAAIEAALQRKPDATFLVQGAIPAPGSAELRATDTKAAAGGVKKVFQSLQDMGLPADRISVSVTTLPMLEDGEIRVYVH